jgi:hypothetical protein
MAQGKLHKPTEDTRKMVREHLVGGSTQINIARKLGIEEDCFRKHYKPEIDDAVDDVVAEGVGALMRSVREGNIAAIIFLLKTKGRWRSEDSKMITESNDDLAKEMKELRAQLDAKNRKDY